MVPQHLAVEVDDVAPVPVDELGLFEEAAVILVRHETDFHALLLVGGLEIVFARHATGVRLGQFAQRKKRVGQLLLPQ